MSRIAQWLMLAAVCIVGSQPAPAQDAARDPKLVAPAQSSGPIGRDDNWTKWLGLPEVAPQFDLHWRPFDADFSKTVGDGLRTPRDAPSIGSTNPSERFSVGNSYFGIETQKGLQNPFRRTDCANDDECADYSGLPKSEPPSNKKNLKNLKKPYIGLSVTKPIQ
jgi:hypothetical protein